MFQVYKKCTNHNYTIISFVYPYRYELIILKGQQSPTKHTKDFTRNTYIFIKKIKIKEKPIWNFPIQKRAFNIQNKIFSNFRMIHLPDLG